MSLMLGGDYKQTERTKELTPARLAEQEEKRAKKEAERLEKEEKKQKRDAEKRVKDVEKAEKEAKKMEKKALEQKKEDVSYGILLFLVREIYWYWIDG